MKKRKNILYIPISTHVGWGKDQVPFPVHSVTLLPVNLKAGSHENIQIDSNVVPFENAIDPLLGVCSCLQSEIKSNHVKVTGKND